MGRKTMKQAEKARERERVKGLLAVGFKGLRAKIKADVLFLQGWHYPRN